MLGVAIFNTFPNTFSELCKYQGIKVVQMQASQLQLCVKTEGIDYIITNDCFVKNDMNSNCKNKSKELITLHINSLSYKIKIKSMLRK